MGRPPFASVAAPSRDSVGRLLLRLLLVVVGFGLVWVMEDRWLVAREEFARRFEWPTGPWLVVLGVGVLVGLAFGMAACMPTRFSGYRWGRMLVLGIPSLLVLVLGLVFLTDLSSVDALPPLLRDFVSRLIGVGGPLIQPLAAAVVGLAVASGFAEPRVKVTPVAGGPATGALGPMPAPPRPPTPAPERPGPPSPPGTGTP